MSQRGRRQENRERKSDIEKQLGSQDDGVDLGGNKTNLDPTGELIFKWHAMFVVSCVIAVSMDPLFFYLPVINQADKCVRLDKRLKITAICLRSVFDMIYFANIILEFVCPYIDEDASRISGRTEIVTNARLIAKRYLKTYFAIDIFAILPIPQVSVPIIFSKMSSSKFLGALAVLLAFVLLQYWPRVLRIYLSWRNLIESSRELARRVWIKAAFYIFLYILASHVLGAFWYFFSIQRETFCWHVACENHIGCAPSSFKCGRNFGNYTFLDDNCPPQSSNITLVDFGIFLEAHQSGIGLSSNILPRIMHCFWWGLRNLSSLGQNLQTSSYFLENCFSAYISIFGLLLFLYFIGTVQTYMQIATEKSEEITQNMKHKELDIKLWMSRNKLPDEMKERIISCIQHRLKENKDFDTEKPIPHLSNINLVKEIKRHLCLPLLKKVQSLNNESEYLLRLICESLKPLYYNEESYILREGEPLTAMLFITQGSVCCFKTSNGENGEGIVSGAECIEKGQFYGEQVLKWGFNSSFSPRLSDLPISTKTVKALTKVEAFALTANNLKNLVVRQSQATSAAKGFAQAVRRRLNERKNENPPKKA
ncbi:cyclic nucleotide-gated ion channel 1-like [Corylus avellana]|uniref:cyclic nucleotide-gated ion channel 1-like n=1 Tax=Corylus avellana TaxID=13451 RepID=UPI00286A3C84|nr:cyclic nucleotide-gated ion channel 1-like [Corylus avellana]